MVLSCKSISLILSYHRQAIIEAKRALFINILDYWESYQVMNQKLGCSLTMRLLALAPARVEMYWYAQCVYHTNLQNKENINN